MSENNVRNSGIFVDVDRRSIFDTILLVFFIAVERTMQRIKVAENFYSFQIYLSY